jgi:hypothetical protein
MKRSRSFPHHLEKQLLRSEAQRRRARGLATLGSALSLLAATPAGAALVTIDNQTVNTTVLLGSGDSLQVTGTGIVDVATGIGVVNAGSGTTLGDIVNAGSISSGDNDAVVLGGSSTVTGDIRNEGHIAAGFDGIFVNTNSVVQGSIVNAAGGVITGGNDGMEIQDGATVNTDIVNDGAINAATDGIKLDFGGKVDGHIVNNGTIDAGEDGIDLTSGGTSVGGNISNTGLIRAGDDGIDLNTGGTVTGAVLNSGRIEAQSDGILLTDGAEVQGGITNTSDGTIQAGADGIDVSSGSRAQSITNEGTITAVESGIEVDSTAEITGAITNTGTITGDGASIFVSSFSTVGGGITNSGILTGALGIVGDDGLGGGIDLLNSGTVAIGASESFLSGDYTQEATGTFELSLRMNAASYLFAPMIIIGDAILDGMLTFRFANGFGLSAGDRFTLFEIVGTRTGTFANYAQDALVASSGARQLFIDYTPEGNIDLYSVPEPGSLALLGIGALGGLARRRWG